jgi:integrase
MPNITARQAAERWGVSESMARRILSDVPAAGGRDIDTGAKLYSTADADAAFHARPGRGTRNDLAAPTVAAEDYQRLVTDDSIPAAHRALWALMHSGMRVGDALGLDVRDIDLDEKTVHVEAPVKDPEPRRIPLSEDAASLVRQLLAERADGPLFVSETGRPVSRYSASKFARAAAGMSIHAFKPRPHSMDPTKIPVRMGDLEVEDIIDFDGREITVQTVKRTKSPSGGQDLVQVNLGTGFPIFGGANEVVTMRPRQ